MWVARSLGMHDKPVVVLDTDGLYDPLRAQVALMAERGLVRPQAIEAIGWAGSVAEALDLVEAGLAAARHLVPTVDEVLEAEL